jgi:outer membrane translocation and assembly module TamA
MLCETALASGGRKPSHDPCPQIVVRGTVEPALNVAEYRWLCGDPASPAYKEVPLYQAAFHLRSFLDNRGYIRAEMKIQNDVLVVDPGEPVRLKTVDVNPDEPELAKIAERQRGEIVRPALLNKLESSLQRRQRESGYPCAVVSSQARGEAVSLQVSRGPLRTLGDFRAAEIPGLRPEALTRFQPFDADSVYDVRLLELYEKRLLRDNVVQGTYFKDNCKSTRPHIEQSFLLGPPRTLRFGIGIDTEIGPLLQSSWRHHRFSDMAAQASFTLQASLTQQSLTARTEYFPWHRQARLSINPQLKLLRLSGREAIEISNSIETLAARSWDAASAKWTLAAGPGFISSWSKTRAEPEFHQESSAALLGRAEFRTHAFETFDAHPQDGFLVGVTGEYRDPVLGFADRTFKLAADGRAILPLGLCGKGRCIAGLRVLSSQTWTSADSLGDLPLSLKTYLGGFDSLRGYALQSFPDNDGFGALASLASGFEFRALDVFVPRWEPYLFFDIGSYGLNGTRLNEGPFSAVGLGLRWISPIGLVQGYVARPSLGGVYFYASLGGEF